MAQSNDYESDLYLKNSLKRFYKKIKIQDNECWLWMGSTNEKYGVIRFKNIQRLAHRFSFEYIKKTPINNMMVCHSCDNPLCVNPDHLFLGTHKDNMKDAKSKKRHAYGEKHYQQKLKLKDIEEIRKLVKCGMSQTEIAKIFNIQQTNISLILKGKNWKYAPPDIYNIDILLKCIEIMFGDLQTYKLLKFYDKMKESYVS